MIRIVSLIPSATEIVCALGFEKGLVGRSHECDFPAEVRQLPICTEPAFNPAGNSRAIDTDVKNLLRQALSIYKVDTNLLRDLAPDVIVTQAQCDVCAVSLKEVERAVSGWLGKYPVLVSLVPNSLGDVWSDFKRVAAALNVPEKGLAEVTRMKSKMENICFKAKNLKPHPTVACIEWIDPLMAAGNWMPELVGMAGGDNLFGEAGKHSPWMKKEDLYKNDPEVIIVLPCGFDMARSRIELEALTDQVEWNGLRAVRAGRVYVTDGNQYFNRPGPRLVESLEILAEILHPDVFQFGHENKAWQRI